MKQKIYFTADEHLGHKNLLKHCPKRIELCGAKDENDIEAHDKWLIDLWNSTVNKRDEIYILGDFSFHTAEDTKKLLAKLNGNKHLILGNHDKSSEKLDSYFKSITQIKEKTFKQNNYDFLKEDFRMYLCHFPLISWPAKNHGAIMLHGHCHGNIDAFNDGANDLRVDVGLDGSFANYNLVSLEQVYDYALEKARKIMPHDTLREFAKHYYDELRLGIV